jgi:threonine dehydrogenase-like Zn-dependent dehydrogenase
VTAVGLCGSDLHWFSEGDIGDARLQEPLVLGHEFAGVIENGERRGQRVAVDPAVPCSGCEFCLEGNPNLCADLRFAGYSTEDGALREYMAWPTHCLHPLPDSLTDADGVMLEPLGVAIHAVDLGHLRPGMTVGVFGCGPVGLLVLQVARVAGATHVIATDKLPHRLEAAQSLGATAVFQATDGRESALHHRVTMAQHSHAFAPASGDVDHLECRGVLARCRVAAVVNQVYFEATRFLLVPGDAFHRDVLLDAFRSTDWRTNAQEAALVVAIILSTTTRR